MARFPSPEPSARCMLRVVPQNTMRSQAKSGASRSFGGPPTDRTILGGMAASPKRKNIVKKRTYTSARLAVVRAQLPEPQRLLRVWKRVLERRLRARLRTDVAVEVHDNTHTMVTFERMRRGW